MDIGKQKKLEVAMYNGRKFFKPEKYPKRTPNKDFWLVKDTAGHAGSQYKVYRERGAHLEFECSIDSNGKKIDKNESKAGDRIKKKDLAKR